MNPIQANSVEGRHVRLLERMCRKMLQPIIGLLLRGGMPYMHFANIAKSVYVRVAATEFGSGGQLTSTSRIAILTGLSRPQVKREREHLTSPATSPAANSYDHLRHAARILLGWHTDPEFVDADGAPRVLRETGGSASFAGLYERYSGKVVPATAMLKELLEVGAIEATEDGGLRVVTRFYTPAPTDPASWARVCLAVADLAETGKHNLYLSGEEARRLERTATNQLIHASDLPEFHDFLQVEGQQFLERVDNWLAAHERRDEDDELIRVGTGVYQISPSGSQDTMP